MKLWIAAGCAAATLYAQSARITGRITTERGQPLRGEVMAVASDSAVRMSPALTDADGTFTVDVRPGRALLVARAEGYVSEEKELTVRADNGNPPLHFALARAGSVSGRVVDETGAGVPGARVWSAYPSETRRWRPVEEAGGEPADNLGQFTLTAVAQGRPFVLYAEADGWLLSSSGTLMLRAPEISGVLLWLSRHGAAVRGRVADAAGNPVPGAQIYLRCLPADGQFTVEQRASLAFARSTNKTAVSAAGGTYFFTGVPSGHVVVTARIGGHHAATQATIPAGRDTEINLTLH